MYLFSHANDGSRRGGMGHGLVDRFLGGMARGGKQPPQLSYTKLQYHKTMPGAKKKTHVQNHFTTWKMDENGHQVILKKKSKGISLVVSVQKTTLRRFRKNHLQKNDLPALA